MEAADKKRRVLTIACSVLLIAVMIYLFHDVFTSNYKEYETVTTDETVYQDTVELNSFIIRDEEYIDGGASATVVPLVSDGKRVASGDAVALLCKSEEDAANYAALNSAKEERERYVALGNRTKINTIDMEKLNADINKSYAEARNLTYAKFVSKFVYV